MHKTIYPAMNRWREIEPGPRRDRVKMAYDIVVDQTFGGHLDNPDHAIAVFRQHTADVCNTIPAERLLVYDVKQGWEPLCEFLSVPVPEIPFPRVNTADAFQQRPRT